jgi:hypothetical protein
MKPAIPDRRLFPVCRQVRDEFGGWLARAIDELHGDGGDGRGTWAMTLAFVSIIENEPEKA